MNSKIIQPIILSGGSGKRLWPLSRSCMPKQFANLFKKHTLFQKTIIRLDDKIFCEPIIVTGEVSRFIAKRQLEEINKGFAEIIIEPEPKDTAAAALVGIIHSKKLIENPTVLILPADHWIENSIYFKELIRIAYDHIDNDNIITFGIKPTYPNTGYGWIELNPKEINNTSNIQSVINFYEKPNLEKASEFFLNKSFYWNSGIYLGKASSFVNSYKKFDQRTMNLVKDSYEKAKKDLFFLRIDEKKWKKLKNVSLDYAIIEKHKKINMIPFEEKWSDIGSLLSLMEYHSIDKESNVVQGSATSIDCNNTFLKSENEKIHIVGLGLNNIIAISTQDAVICLEKNKSENVKKAVEILEQRGIDQANNSLYDFRPWGSFEVLSKGKNYQVKKIEVYPFCKLSLQSHKYRSEHWVVVKGEARIILGDEVKIISENESVYINSGVKHRLENATKKTITIIEVQTGTYLGEDDIVRYEDDYKRLNSE